MDNNTWINFILTIVGTVIGGVFLLVIEYWVIQPNKDKDWGKRFTSKSLMKYFAAIFSLFIPVLIARDYLIGVISHLPVEGNDRLNLYATILAITAAVWGVVWGILIRPRLFLYS